MVTAMRTLIAVLVGLLLPTLTDAADKAKPVDFEVKNTLTFERGQTLVSHSIDLTGKARLLGPDGKELACSYDSKQKKLLFLDTFKAAETKKYQVVNEEPKVKPPKWTTKMLKDELELKMGKRTVKCQGGSIDNGLLRLRVFRNDELRAEVEVTALKGGYKFRCNPLGSAVGCIDDKKYAAEIDDVIAKGGDSHPQLMNVYCGVPEKVEFVEINAFQRLIKVACTPFAVKSNKEMPEVLSESSMNITLTWGSPVVEIKSHRKVATVFYNHNGVYLNEFYLSQFPIDLSVDGEAEAKHVEAGNITNGALNTNCTRFLLLKYGDAKASYQTVIYVPDFEKCGIEGPRFSAFKDRMMTVISQSWHQGWKPIEIKAQDYDDRVVLVCDIASSLKPEGKKYGDWVEEVEKPAQ